ncbi:DUF1620-domain-containing protein [Guyanagaster necrorhizus]|uniref:ER membrane protein complex subunit 1 n=1 Tax=Guyanagaster necrorhizus TaxID=856835 RepID=A0A9P7VTV1_9AGAR|nr:DUF1620-domain-containing protein [Guyanagaster necrorhizus MCA 3950]KAG7447298.1 DUF1620-domain-containing protein [Guyanagaster necrorhizus MCA 3950]
MRLVSLLIVASWLGTTLGIQESDAGIIDWHKLLVGVPLVDSTSAAPIFHRVGGKNTKSVILTATKQNVLAALNPVDGSVAWRHVFEPEDTVVTFEKQDTTVASLSGPGGATLRSFDILSGLLLLEKRLHPPETSLPLEPGHTGSSIVFTADSDIIALTNGHMVQFITKSGNIRWTWTLEDQSSLVIYTHVIATSTAIYAVGLAKSYSSYILHVAALSPESGQLLSTAHVASSVTNPSTDLALLTSNTVSRLAWLEQGALKSVALSASLKEKPTTIKGATYRRLLDVGLSKHGYMVAIMSDGAGRVFRLEEDGSALNNIWEFEGSAYNSRHSESLYAGGFDKIGYPYIGRLYWSHAFKFASAELLAPHLASGKGLVTGFSFPFDTYNHGVITHITMDAANPSPFTVLGRFFLTTTTGTVQLWQQDKLQWTREESLASVRVAEFVELPEHIVTSSHDRDEQFSERVRRHISDAQNFPRYLLNFVRRFATGSYASASSSVAAKDGSLSRDAFGFRQIILVATDFGKLFALDSSNGNVLWSRILGLGWAAEVGGKHLPVKIFVTRTVSDGESPQAVLVTQRRANNGLLDTTLFHFDALTGLDARSNAEKSKVLEGTDIPEAMVDAFMLHKDDTRVIIVLDELLQAHLYPDTDESKKFLLENGSSLHFPLQMNVPDGRQVVGHHLAEVPSLSGYLLARPTWTLSLAHGETIQSLVPAARGPVASIGKVLGNRTTLYKYLNPRTFVVLTDAVASELPGCGLYVVDAAKGTIIYQVSLPANVGKCDIRATLTENWLIYHYYDEDFSGVGQAKGYRMVTVELYEGSRADDKTQSSELCAYSKDNSAIRVFEQSYVFPHGISAIGTTTTKFGISSKDAIVATTNNKVQSFSRRLLNPRRPSQKPSSEEAEEQLVQYDPVLPDDPRRVLSHTYEVAKIRRIITSPALLESTCLVFVYGLDMFLSRVAPSKTFDVLDENFNKAQLVFTVLGLAAAIGITKPIVRNKKLREKWYQ